MFVLKWKHEEEVAALQEAVKRERRLARKAEVKLRAHYESRLDRVVEEAEYYRDEWQGSVRVVEHLLKVYGRDMK